MPEHEIRIAIDDWVDEFLREEPTLDGEDALVAEHVKRRWTPTKTARLAIAARELSAAPEDILPPNKPLLNLGGAVAVVQLINHQRQRVMVGGKQRSIPTYVGSVPEPQEEGKEDDGQEYVPETYTDALSAEGCQRAREYLLRIVPGHVYRRLLVLAANGDELVEVAEQLKSRIDAMIAELQGETEAEKVQA